LLNHPTLARSERMKEAKYEAQELIDSYRGEKQQEFNNKVVAAGTILFFCFPKCVLLFLSPRHFDFLPLFP
jgi:hypothetical protein